ncbi:MAG: ribosomal protein S18-alanine N-acetyltransferase [Rubrivivax sp.]
MSALLRPQAQLQPLMLRDLDAVLAIEVSAYRFPWSRGNFIDSLSAGYLAEMVVDARAAPIAYCVAMPGVDEMHLLNLTVAPPYRRQGHACALLDSLQAHCRDSGLPTLWLEVRAGNERARQVYARRGFSQVGVRKGYYPAGLARREDALVMSLTLPQAH